MYIIEFIFVLTCDGRTIVGQLMGHDQVQNLILGTAVERIYSNGEDEAEEVPLGLYVIRGDNVVLVGELDDESESTSPDKKDEWKSIVADPLPEIHQHVM